jgi:hypothetical protein
MNRFVLASAYVISTVVETDAVQNLVNTNDALVTEDYDYEDEDADTGKGKSGKGEVPVPVTSPTPRPTNAPTPYPTPQPTDAPTMAPTQSPPTWTGWVNSWDQPVNWVAPSGYVMTGVHSKHDNGKEDRLWDFQQSKMLDSTSPVMTGFVNNWDQEFTHSDDNKVFVGMYSEHHNSYEDRKFKIYQSGLGSTAHGCYWTGETDWDAEWTLSGNTNEGITGMWSRHDNRMEDRKFKFRFCNIAAVAGVSPTPAPAVATWSGWVNSWDQPVDWQASQGSVMTGVHSKHDNGKEDRLWDYQQFPMFSSTSPSQSDFVNDWDGEFTYGTDSRIFTGMYSEHRNDKEDRRFKIWTTNAGVAASGCYWTSETNWDAEWTLQAGNGEAITGMWSRHDNNKEDRLFKFRFCKFV